MPLVIRPAEYRHFSAVAALLGELGRPRVGPDAVTLARQVYARYIARPDTASLVAEVDGPVVGFMSLELRERLNWVRPQAWVPDLIVSAAYRGRGIGKELLRRGIALARGRSCWSIVLESGRSRYVAHQLYRYVGMINEGEYFILYFSDGG